MNINDSSPISSPSLTWEWIKASPVEQIQEKLAAFAAVHFDDPALSKLNSQSLKQYSRQSSKEVSSIDLVHKLGQAAPEDQISLVYQKLLGKEASDYFLEESLTLFIENGEEARALQVLKTLNKFDPQQFISACGHEMDRLAKKMVEIDPVFLNERDETGETLLFEVCAEWNAYPPEMGKAAIKMMVELGAEINCQDVLGQTPLHIACEDEEKLDLVKILVKILVKLGADISIKDKGERTPRDIAILNGNMDIYYYLYSVENPPDGSGSGNFAAPAA